MKSYNPFRLCSHRDEINNSDDEFLFHEQQLNRNLAEYDIQRLQVKGDGNCLFYALAQGLIYEIKMDPNRFTFQLQTFGLSTNLRLSDFANRLRQICIEQWKSNEQFYSQFVDTQNISFLKEVKKFSKTGVSDSTLGDIVPLTISNTFNIKIIIFTSVSNLSRIDIKPTNGNNSSLLPQKIIYLAYNQYGIGHYDAAYPRT
jgi:superfamily I DNA and/or RNA helicase